MAFPEQLKKARLAIGYTQQQVADAMGITNSTYCGYETGKRQPDVAKIKQLAKILHTSLKKVCYKVCYFSHKKSPPALIGKRVDFYVLIQILGRSISFSASQPSLIPLFG